MESSRHFEVLVINAGQTEPMSLNQIFEALLPLECSDKILRDLVVAQHAPLFVSVFLGFESTKTPEQVAVFLRERLESCHYKICPSGNKNEFVRAIETVDG